MTKRFAHTGYKPEFAQNMIKSFTDHALKTIEHIKYGNMDEADIFRSREFICYVFVALMSRGSFSEDDKRYFSKMYDDGSQAISRIVDRWKLTGRIGCTGDEKTLLIDCVDIAHQLLTDSIEVCIRFVVAEYLTALRILNDVRVPKGTLTEKQVKRMVKEEADKLSRVDWIENCAKHSREIYGKEI